MTIQYREKKTEVDGWSEWKDVYRLNNSDFGGPVTFYSCSRHAIQVRKKPPFEPGYFRINTRTGPGFYGDRVPSTVYWFVTDPGPNYRRVNVTAWEED